MILVTGTKRAGTSMWMQVLKAAGLPIIGEAFPRDWGDTLRDANPEGFYESPLRDGIHHRSNPDRRGRYLHPADTREHVVKVFVPGLVKTDLAFVDCVLATIRPFRAHHASIEKLYRMEHANRQKLRGRALPEPRWVTPALEWWAENHQLIVDAAVRRYPLRLVSYERVVEAPAETVRATLDWIGAGDVDAATRAVHAELRRHDEGELPTPPDLDAAHVAVFDELHARIHDEHDLDDAFVARLNATHTALLPRIEREMREVRAYRTQQRLLARKRARDAQREVRASPPSID